MLTKDNVRVGNKIVFSFPNTGYPSDRKNAEKHLKSSEVYTVKHILAHPFSTKIVLEGIPGAQFDIVLFNECTPVSSS